MLESSGPDKLHSGTNLQRGGVLEWVLCKGFWRLSRPLHPPPVPHVPQHVLTKGPVTAWACPCPVSRRTPSSVVSLLSPPRPVTAHSPATSWARGVHPVTLKQNNMFAAVTVTSALAFKGVGPKAHCLSTDI